MEKSFRKYAANASPRPLYNFGKKTQNSHCKQKKI